MADTPATDTPASTPTVTVDEGDPPRELAALLRELAPSPGRFGNTVRLVVICCALVGLCEWFRIPEPAVAGYIAVYLSKEDAASTIQAALVVAVFGLLGIALAIVGFTLSLSQPALRIPLIAAVMFGSMFLSRAATLGPAFFLLGFLCSYSLTFGDQLEQAGLAPDTVANTPQFSLPYALFVPPEEALLYNMLWLAVAMVLAVTAVVAVNLLAGQHPSTLLRRGLAARLDALAAACADRPRAVPALRQLTLDGNAALVAQAGRAARHQTSPSPVAVETALIEPVGRLMVGVLAWKQTRPGTSRALRDDGLRVLVPVLQDWRRAVLDGRGQTPGRPPALDRIADGDPIQAPLAVEIDATARRVADAFRPTDNATASTPKPGQAGLLKPDAFREPEYLRFAVRVTLAAMVSYLCYTGMDWSGIHTAMVTCLFVPQDSLGQTLHKGMLRIGGCLVGAGLAIGTILLLMPSMTGLWQLLVMIGAVTFVGGWVANGSARVGYAGLQLVFAFYLVVLQGFGPTLDMETGRDRVIGILFGLLVTTLVFGKLWPMRVADLVRPRLAAALIGLADQVGHCGSDAAGLIPFSRGMTAIRGLMVDDVLERPVAGRPRAVIDARLLMDLQALVIPLAIVQRLRDAAEAVRTGQPPVDPAPMPQPPEPPAGREAVSWTAWYARLDGELRSVGDRLLFG